MKDKLENLKTREFIGVKELSDAAVEILREVGPSQEKGTVAEYPNERTVRYYLSEGLLPTPSDKRSQASVFGYEHLLTLLAIKKLQADGLPINVIRTLLDGKDVDDLEGLLDERMTQFTDRQSASEPEFEADMTTWSLEMAADEPDDRPITSPPAAAARNEAKSFLESLLSRKKKSDPAPSEPPAIPQALFSRAPKSAEPPAEEWKRYELAPGLELQVERKFRPPEDRTERERILDLIKKILRISS